MQVGDDFLVGGAEAVVALVAVLEAQELVLAVVFPSAGFAPQVGWACTVGMRTSLSARPRPFRARTMAAALFEGRASPSGSHV